MRFQVSQYCNSNCKKLERPQKLKLHGEWNYPDKPKQNLELRGHYTVETDTRTGVICRM